MPLDPPSFLWLTILCFIVCVNHQSLLMSAHMDCPLIMQISPHLTNVYMKQQILKKLSSKLFVIRLENIKITHEHTNKHYRQ